MPGPSLVVLLVEDHHQQQLFDRFLRKAGLRRHAIRIVKAPAGQGSAEQWVRQRFVVEVRACRTRHAQTVLIAAVDADTNTVEERLLQLDDAVRCAGIPPTNQASEKIARLIPRRNVETWVLCLNGQDVDEDTDYKRKGENWPDLIRSAADRLYKATKEPDSVSAVFVPSLQAGVKELNRLAL